MENIGQLASWYSEYGSICTYIYIYTSLSGGTCHKIATVQATQRYQAELQDFVDGSLATFQELKSRCKKRKAWLARLDFSRSLATWCREAQGRHRFLNTAPFGSNGSRPEAREIYFRRRRSMLQRPEDGNDGMLWNTWWRQNLPHAFPRAG